jgi:hypothetical protein
VPIRRPILTTGLLLALAQPVTAQGTDLQPDSARAQIRGVLRAFYFNLQSHNWDALAAYVLSPKLLERRGAPADLQMVVRDRTRSRGAAHVSATPRACKAASSPMIEEATIGLDGDWADVAVPRCHGASAGVDEFGMIYFEQRWRFIYTDLFESAPSSVP